MVSSYLQLLRRRYHGQIDEDADTFIDYAVEGASRMRTLIEDLLAYSRAGRAERALEPVDTARWSPRWRPRCARQASAAPEIEWATLPVVHGDAVQLAPAVPEPDRQRREVRRPTASRRGSASAPSEEGAAWRFAVEDNGIGIEPATCREGVRDVPAAAHARRVRGDRDRPGDRRRSSSCHGGRIRVVPRAEGGARFEFTLRRGGAHERAPAVARSRSRTTRLTLA